ncbi:hypothetical protein I6I10_04230 [Corynebacterium glucuronolyticum]|uniref:Uncharacterized protein n=1 Tax=Corynebacterium glucuronolyticum TaxID=39791 RepID=A0A7T4EGT7_9CORY|nr:hypothetical protein [Corynebacterium glucuronolyticum]QQB47124.1 hypothetical protein I6I10_04230 [Corynebacterium glucuronolyticum]
MVRGFLCLGYSAATETSTEAERESKETCQKIEKRINMSQDEIKGHGRDFRILRASSFGKTIPEWSTMPFL